MTNYWLLHKNPCLDLLAAPDKLNCAFTLGAQPLNALDAMLKPQHPDARLLEYFSATDAASIEQALALLPPDDPNYYRPTGKQVAQILLDFHVDLNTITAALLSDPRLNGKLITIDIVQRFGPAVMTLIQDVNWLNTLSVYSVEVTHQESQQAEILRRMLLSMTHDARAVIIKLAYRVQRLHTLPREEHTIRQFIAHETLDIYAPIANRLGVSQLKWELEDLAFRYLQPHTYKNIAQSLASKRQQRLSCIENFISQLKHRLQQENINAKIYGRPKHIYSIWKKMQRKKLGIDELYDLLAIRVIVDNLSHCYTVLGIVHSQWQYIPKEFDDYIANPKENGYQSLHTVILDVDGNRIEVQIRTHEMDEFAELGVAAHWRYKEGGDHNTATERSIAALRQLLAKKESDDMLLESFKTSLFYDRVYVLTPKGKLLDLVKGSTPLDFAYAIHSDIGHRCRGAKVNGRIVNLTYTLKSGEQVEIITAKHGEPNRNWLDTNLGYLKSPHAISKVKNWFKQQQLEQNIALGRNILEKEIHRLGLVSSPIKELCAAFNEPDSNKLLASIGRGDINSRQIASKLSIPELKIQTIKPQSSPGNAPATILVDGIANVLTSLAHCCNPLPGDDIGGYISHYKGITIHKLDCKSFQQRTIHHPEQRIEVAWSEETSVHTVAILIEASTGNDLLNNVSQIFSQARCAIIYAQLKTLDDQSCLLNLSAQIKNTRQLSQMLSKINDLPNVIDVKRKS